MRLAALLSLTLMVSTGIAGETPVPVADNLRQAMALSRFLALGLREDTAAGDRFGIAGLNVSTESGTGSLSIQQIQVTRGGKTTLLSGIKLAGPMVVNDAYINNPIGGLLTAVVKKGEIRIDKIEQGTAAKPTQGSPQGAKDVVVKINAGAFDCTLSYGFVGAKATGTIAYDPATRKLVVTIASVSAGIPIGLDKIFQELANTLTFDWSVVSKPTVTLAFDEMFR